MLTFVYGKKYNWEENNLPFVLSNPTNKISL